MPPNPKHPKFLQHWTVKEAPLTDAMVPDHVIPLATNGDTLPTLEAKEDDLSLQQSSNNESNVRQRKERILEQHNPLEDDDATRIVRTILRKYSSIVQDPEQFTIDEKRLQKAMKDAGKYVHGIQGISVWIFDQDHDRLVMPPGGFWYHPPYKNEPVEALEELVEDLRSSNVPVVSVVPGTDIAGLLWLEASNHHAHRQQQKESSSLVPPAGSSSQVAYNRHFIHPFSALHWHDATSTLVWRDLKSLVQDPDTAKGPHLVLMEKAGFGQATGIPFQAGVGLGLVIFFVQTDLDPVILNGTVHTSYLRQSAQFIGTAAAMTEARRAMIGQQRHAEKSPDEVLTGVEKGDYNAMSTIDLEKIEAQQISSKEFLSQTNSWLGVIPKRVQVWFSKIRGGGLQIPPPLSMRQSLWTAFGTFCGLLVLSLLNEFYMRLSQEEYYLLLGPFGALMTLQYGLTAAPASQPRNAVMGQVVAGAISLAFTSIPEYILATWLRRAIGPAIAIAVMVKLGLTHPPAGAHAVLYASGKYNFAFYALVVVSTVISIIPATLVNNMSRKRQYPIYWGFPSFLTTRSPRHSKSAIEQ